MSRTSSESNTLRRLKRSTISCMKPLGAVRSRPCPSLLERSAIRVARIFSRSSAITCMREFSRSRESTGISTVRAVAKAAIAASSVTMMGGLISEVNWSSMALASLEAS